MVVHPEFTNTENKQNLEQPLRTGLNRLRSRMNGAEQFAALSGPHTL